MGCDFGCRLLGLLAGFGRCRYVGCIMRRHSTGCCRGVAELCDPCASGYLGGGGWSDVAAGVAGVGGSADFGAVAAGGVGYCVVLDVVNPLFGLSPKLRRPLPFPLQRVSFPIQSDRLNWSPNDPRFLFRLLRDRNHR